MQPRERRQEEDQLGAEAAALLFLPREGALRIRICCDVAQHRQPAVEVDPVVLVRVVVDAVLTLGILGVVVGQEAAGIIRVVDEPVSVVVAPVVAGEKQRLLRCVTRVVAPGVGGPECVTKRFWSASSTPGGYQLRSRGKRRMDAEAQGRGAE